MKTLIRFSIVKIRFLFHPFTSRKSLYVWHNTSYYHARGLFYLVQIYDSACMLLFQNNLKNLKCKSSYIMSLGILFLHLSSTNIQFTISCHMHFNNIRIYIIIKQFSHLQLIINKIKGFP